MLYLNPTSRKFLEQWKYLGLDVISLSMYHYVDALNEQIFRPKNPRNYRRTELTKMLIQMGFDVRWSCVMLKGYVDGISVIDKFLEQAKQTGVFQVTLRTADRPKISKSDKHAKFVDENTISGDQLLGITLTLSELGRVIETMPHGARIFDYKGQNVCLTSGLSRPIEKDSLRQLIFFPQGWLTTSWEYVHGGRIL